MRHIAIICALGRNRAIGRDNRLLWRIPGDLQRFKRITMGHAMIMGRKTLQSLGRALPGRTNLVLSRDPSFAMQGCHVFPSLERALQGAEAFLASPDDEIFIIGGGEVYREALPLADRLYLTIVDDAPGDADTFFPPYDDFEKVEQEEPFSTQNGLSGRLLVLAQSARA